MTRVDHSAMRLGRTPSRPEDLARVPKVSAILGSVIPEVPSEIDNLSCMTSIGMDGNDEYGDCFYAALAHIIQAQTALMGKERIFTREEVLAMYARGTGWNKLDPSTDQGANMYDGLIEVVKNRFCEIEIEGFGLVDGADFAKCHEGLYVGGGLLWGIDLPLTAQRQVRWRSDLGAGDVQASPGGWGGHAVHQGYSIIQASDGLSEEVVTTWGAKKPVAQTFRDGGYISEVYVVWIKDFVPKIPGFDHARFLAGIKEVRL